MSWSWHGQGLPPPMLSPQQPLPPPFPAPGHHPPPPPPAWSFPYGHAPPPPPFFNPPAPTPYQSSIPWPSNPHGMPWQQHQVAMPTPRNMGPAPTQGAHKRRRPNEFSERPPVRPERPRVPAERQNKNAKGKKVRKSDWPAKEMAMSKEILSKLQASLPGESQAEIDRWVAARKRNWPSRANVARKLAEKKKREKGGAQMKGEVKKRARVADNSLTMLAAEYGSSDGEIDETDKKTRSVNGQSVVKKETKGVASRQRGRGVAKKRQRGRRNGKKSNRNVSTAPRRPSLLKMLLQKEIHEERSMLLQAFRHIINQKRNVL